MSDFTTEWERPEFDSVPTLAEDMAYLLPGCDAVLIRKMLQSAYRDFCRRSAALRTWRSVPAAHGVHAFPIAPILSGEIDCVTQVLDGRTRHEVRDWRVAGDPPVLEVPNWRVHRVLGGVPPFLWVEAVEIPHIGEDRAPKAFLRRYGDALVDGALTRLFSMTAKPWTDAEQARQRGVAYANALSEARQRSMCGGPSANANAGFALDMSSMV